MGEIKKNIAKGFAAQKQKRAEKHDADKLAEDKIKAFQKQFDEKFKREILPVFLEMQEALRSDGKDAQIGGHTLSVSSAKIVPHSTVVGFKTGHYQFEIHSLGKISVIHYGCSHLETQTKDIEEITAEFASADLTAFVIQVLAP